MITIKSATDTTTRTQTARIYDGSARNLTIGHLRAFLEQVELTGFDDETEVRFSSKLNSSDPRHTIEISASRSSSEKVDIVPQVEA